MNSSTNCHPSQDTLILSSLSDEKCLPHGTYSPTEQKKEPQQKKDPTLKSRKKNTLHKVILKKMTFVKYTTNTHLAQNEFQ